MTTFSHMGLQVTMAKRLDEVDGFVLYIEKENPSIVKKMWFNIGSNDRSNFKPLNFNDPNFDGRTEEKRYFWFFLELERVFPDKDKVVILGYRFFSRNDKGISPVNVSKVSNESGGFDVLVDVFNALRYAKKREDGDSFKRHYNPDNKKPFKKNHRVNQKPANTSVAEPTEDNLGNTGKTEYKDLSNDPAPSEPASKEKLEKLAEKLST